MIQKYEGSSSATSGTGPQYNSMGITIPSNRNFYVATIHLWALGTAASQVALGLSINNTNAGLVCVNWGYEVGTFASMTELYNNCEGGVVIPANASPSTFSSNLPTATAMGFLLIGWLI